MQGMPSFVIPWAGVALIIKIIIRDLMCIVESSDVIGVWRFGFDRCFSVGEVDGSDEENA